MRTDGLGPLPALPALLPDAARDDARRNDAGSVSQPLANQTFLSARACPLCGTPLYGQTPCPCREANALSAYDHAFGGFSARSLAVSLEAIRETDARQAMKYLVHTDPVGIAEDEDTDALANGVADELADDELLRPGALTLGVGDDPEKRQVEPAYKSEEDLNPEELTALRELQQTDREVRSHEAMHIAAGGGVVQGGASYSYEEGPDNRRYAVAGEVAIDVSPVPGDSEATVEKAKTIQRAALAPATPSAQDQAVAAQAARMEAEARTEKREQREEEAETVPGEVARVLEPADGGEDGLSLGNAPSLTQALEERAEARLRDPYALAEERLTASEAQAGYGDLGRDESRKLDELV